MNLWYTAFDDLHAIEAECKDLTIDQRLKVAEIKALLSIGQELSKIHHEGINPEYMTED